MERKIKIGISNRHMHITKETYDFLFDEPLTKKQELHQIGEFASNQVVTIKTEKNCIKNVRIVGPFRNYNQVEISQSDSYKLGINPPVRHSGHLENSETITVESDKGEITLKNACILASRHVHMNDALAKELKLEENQKVQIKIEGEKSCLLDAYVKISENGYFECHIDRDDANATGIKNEEEVLMLYNDEKK